MEVATKGMESAAANYLQDLEALTEEQVLGSSGGASRSPVDFTYEVALINRRIAARLLGQEPPAAPRGDDWWMAPEELRSKPAIADYMKSACDELVAAAKTISEEDAGRMVGSPGHEQPAFGLTNFAAMHTMYHDAQLNFIQSLHGDMAMHWR